MKKFFTRKNIIIAVVVFFVLAAIGGINKPKSDTSTNSNQAQEQKSEQSTEQKAADERAQDTKEEQQPQKLEFTLTTDKPGDYGKEITINEGTSSAKTLIAYYVPAGTYTVKNNGKFATQITVYTSDLKQQKDSTGATYNEQVGSPTQKPVVIKKGESAEITVASGEYVSTGSKGNGQYDLNFTQNS